MQRGLIRQRPRKQRRPCLLILRVSLLSAVLQKGEPWKITIPEHRSGKRIAERESSYSRQKYTKESS